MKMSQKRHKKATLFLSTLLLSSAVFSASIDKKMLATECQFLGMSLSQLAKANPKEYCSKDVSKSGRLMEQSASFIQSNKIDPALDTLVLVGRTLQHVAFNEKDCPYFASMITPFKDKTNYLIRELNSLIHRFNERRIG